MVKGVMLTARDTSLLYDCYRNVVLSFAQLHERHFPKAAKQTVNNRLTRLIRNGFLRRQRVGLFLHHSKPQVIGTVFQIARKGIQFLQTRRPTERLRDEPVRLNSLTLYHDLLLTQAIDALRIRFPGQEIVHSKVFGYDGMSRTRIPDAVILQPNGRPAVAVELELTAKSDARYLEITNAYQQQNLYPKVLYIVGIESIADKVRYPITRTKVTPGNRVPVTTRFYFVTFDALVKNPKAASITNGATEISAA